MKVLVREYVLMAFTCVAMLFGWICALGPRLMGRFSNASEDLGLLFSIFMMLVGGGSVAGSMLSRLQLAPRDDEEEDEDPLIIEARVVEKRELPPAPLSLPARSRAIQKGKVPRGV